MDELFQALNRALERLWKALELALENLEQLRQYLIAKLNRLLEILERVRILLARFAIVFVRYGLIALPPIAGLIISLQIGSIPLFVMVLLLVVLIFYAFFAKNAYNSVGVEDLSKSAFKPEVAPVTRLFAIGFAAMAVIIAYLIDVGFFIGVMIFVIEFFVVFMLRQENSERLRTQ